jgi:glycosyltransferase involved in cell wall biosynthesis
MRFFILTDIPTQWREPVFERVYRQLGDSFHVVYCKNNEKRRLWHVPLGSQPKTILPAITLTFGDNERFFNPGIVPFLLRHRPQIALIFSSIKDPTILLGMFICRLMGTRLILMSDTWLGRDRNINRFQKLARHVVYKWFGDAFVGVSKQTLVMFRHFNPKVRNDQMFLSPLCADNDYFRSRLEGREVTRRFDVILAGRIVREKNPLFFAEVCGRIKERLGKCSALIIGEGEEELKAGMRRVFEAQGVDYTFAGFIQHDALPDYYAQAKVLLLPTAGDCWGVVINEAMVAGTPVVTTALTAAAGELVLDGRNGFVLPLEAELWAERIASLLQSPQTLAAFAECGSQTVSQYSFDNASRGIVAAFRYVEGDKGTAGKDRGRN